MPALEAYGDRLRPTIRNTPHGRLQQDSYLNSDRGCIDLGQAPDIGAAVDAGAGRLRGHRGLSRRPESLHGVFHLTNPSLSMSGLIDSCTPSDYRCGSRAIVEDALLPSARASSRRPLPLGAFIAQLTGGP